MQSKPTIRIEVVEQIRGAFEQLPACAAEQVTKKDAIRMLVRPILAMRSKGYTLPAIARMLSERGIAVTPLILRNYPSARVSLRLDDGAPGVLARGVRAEGCVFTFVQVDGGDLLHVPNLGTESVRSAARGAGPRPER